MMPLGLFVLLQTPLVVRAEAGDLIWRRLAEISLKMPMRHLNL
jgi:hypothetical protein